MFKRFTVVLEALTPISHGDTVTGIDNQTNTRLFMRSNMIIDGKPARVPDISENTLRSVIFRETLHDDLLQRLDIKRGDIPQSVMNLLFSGGNMAAGSKSPGDEIALGHAVKKLYPSLDLLGGAVDGFILPRSRLKLAAWPVAKEFCSALSDVALHLDNYDDLLTQARSVSVFDLLSEETRTRGTGAESEGNQMLYTYETMAAGTKIFLELTFDAHTPDETISSTLHAIDLWDGYFGGQSRQGRGRMTIKQISHENGINSASYTEHIEKYSEAMRDGLITGSLGTQKQLCK